ncbi:Ig-like domain (group 2) [Paenibacillus sp. UNC496MF]|uniref:S-layer homology domain-containing protein n=1 Tax=Paenibacillus sp. UNC496MF TaxID=1502753 RepID=UPI0008E69BF8|nr:S-layer homology domain-containing protein [Paenibacillus sp. UNC496MF]SFI31062.1 Ig-like domain (group 2) [Paenibacillus sp. UNC496MF]
MLGSGKITLTGGKMKFTYDPLLTKTYIKNEAIIGNKMNAVIGSTVQLDMFGDFREYPANYVTQINNHELVGIKWSSSNEAVASVDENGAVTSKSSGSTVITGISGGKASSVTVETVKPEDVKPIKLDLSVPAEPQVGDTFIPTIKATNAYGAVYALDAKDVTFSFKNGKARLQEDGVLIADAEGEEEITATFSGLKATAATKIVAKPTPPADPGNSGPIVIAPPTTPDVDLTKDSIVKSDVFAELAKDKNATMTFAGNGYKWKVNGSDITNPNAAVDLGVNVKHQAPIGKISTPVQVNAKKVVLGLSLNQNGALPGKMTLELPTGNEQAGKKLFFYAVNSADQAPAFVSELTVDENGTVAIPFTSSTAAEYVLMTQKILDFKDADAHWAKADIYYLAGKDMISGVNDSQFLPNNAITRGEFVKLIAGAAGADVSAFTNSSFADVKPADWYSPYVEWAKRNNIVLGVQPDAFAPNEKITREQIAVILVRLSDLLGYTLKGNAQPVHFADEANISAYAREAVNKAQQAGIISGMPNHRFAPAKSATRGEAAKMLATLLKAMEQ